MDLQLQGHVALVTGGASGIGLATARQFAAEGCHVALFDLTPAVSTVAADLLRPAGVQTLGIQGDVAVPQDLLSAVAAVRNSFGRLDHLAHAAAIGSGKFGFPYTNLTPEDWPRVLQVNVMGMVHAAHAVGPALREAGSGTMVFVSSVAGQIGSQTDPPYSASKAANINFAQCLAKDLAPHGVRVNTICPGMVKTPLNRSVWQAWHDQQPPDKRRTYEEWAGDKVRTVVPSGRWQEPADIADMIVFLSSARAQHVIGQTINVDGGFVMHW